MQQVFQTTIKRGLRLEFICQDIDLRGTEVFTPHLHQGLEIKLPEFEVDDEQQCVTDQKRQRIVIIPSQVVHSSERTGNIASILLEKTKITCVCNHQMLSEAIPFAAIAELGIVVPATVNFLQEGAAADPLLPQFAAHAERLLKALFSALTIVLAQSSGDRQTPLTVRAADYINRNYYRHSLSVEDVAGHLGITSNHLVQRFRRETGLTVRQYLGQD